MARSRPTVVVGPWPGRTTVSSSRVRNRRPARPASPGSTRRAGRCGRSSRRTPGPRPAAGRLAALGGRAEGDVAGRAPGCGLQQAAGRPARTTWPSASSRDVVGLLELEPAERGPGLGAEPARGRGAGAGRPGGRRRDVVDAGQRATVQTWSRWPWVSRAATGLRRWRAQSSSTPARASWPGRRPAPPSPARRRPSQQFVWKVPAGIRSRAWAACYRKGAARPWDIDRLGLHLGGRREREGTRCRSRRAAGAGRLRARREAERQRPAAGGAADLRGAGRGRGRCRGGRRAVADRRRRHRRPRPRPPCRGHDHRPASQFNDARAGAPTAPAPGGLRRQIPPKVDRPTFAKPPTTKVDPAKTYVATFQTSCGDFTVKLDPKKAPIDHGQLRVPGRQKFYDSTWFHRIVPAAAGIAVIQGGDPQGTGAGAPATRSRTSCLQPGRLQAVLGGHGQQRPRLGWQPVLHRLRGQLQGPPGQLLVFGEVVDGRDVVDKISKVQVGGQNGDTPQQAVWIEKLTVKES